MVFSRFPQYTVGVGTSIFKDVTTVLPHFESCWLASLRDHLHAVDGWLELDDPQVPPLQREHDQYLMDLALTSTKFKPYQIRLINYCRLYLWVVTVADISNANGTHILETAFQGNPAARVVNPNWCHVHQPI